MIAKRIISAFLIVIGCMWLAGSSVAAAETEKLVISSERAHGPVIGHLKTRDKLITIRLGSDGPLYTVKSHDGKVIAMDLPADELYAQFPELKDMVERGIAGWATIDPEINWGTH
ncbi:hypothetical protein OAC89_01150 [Deltaproteobacteria bacterium]|nr:hypothetical protein [Deltaproteobacteria bacterium]